MNPENKPVENDSLEGLRTALIEDFTDGRHDLIANLTWLTNICDMWFTQCQGFDRKNFDGDVMLAVTELAEAVEADRKPGPSSHVPAFTGVEEEIADAMVRLFHIAGKYKLCLGDAFYAKMQFNFTRPVRHGKRY